MLTVHAGLSAAQEFTVAKHDHQLSRRVHTATAHADYDDLQTRFWLR